MNFSKSTFQKFNLATEMAEEIDFENGDFRKLKGSVTLTLNLDDVEVISFDLSVRPLFISL